MLADTITVVTDTPVWPSVLSGVSTFILVGITAWYTRRTKQIMDHTKRQADLLEEQGNRIDELERRRIVQSVRAVLAELRVNEFISVFVNRGPFLVEAYPASMTALQEAPCTAEILGLLADAHASAIRFNVAYAHDPRAQSDHLNDRALELAHSNIEAAYTAVCADEGLMGFVEWPEFATPIRRDN